MFQLHGTLPQEVFSVAPSCIVVQLSATQFDPAGSRREQTISTTERDNIQVVCIEIYLPKDLLAIVVLRHLGKHLTRH
jgi:hypothetical protein